jgi:membrane fusion protein (multidrug efflux system)
MSVILLGCLFLPACSQKQNAAGKKNARGDQRVQPVEVVTLARHDLEETLSVVGSLAPNESASLRAEVSGLVKSINFEEGFAVRTGQLLLKIDDAELLAQLAQSDSRFNLAKLNLERAENLRKTLSNTQADADRARSEFLSAKAELALLRLRIEKTAIKAPFDGVVGSRNISVGDYVTSQTPITTIDDLSRLKVDFQVPERAMGKIRQGTHFAVVSSASEGAATPSAVEGEVYFVSSVIDRDTRSSQVKGLLRNPPPGLKPGMFANIEVVLDVRKNALTVPEGAILVSVTGTSLIVVRDKGADKIADFVPVKLGLRSRGLVEVEPVNGVLSEKDTVVASGVGGLILYPGARLAPRPLKEFFRTKPAEGNP